MLLLHRRPAAAAAAAIPRALTAYACFALLCCPCSSNGAYVYESVNRKAFHGRPVFFYIYRDPTTGELVWVIGYTTHGKPEDVNDPRYSANTKDRSMAIFDSSPSAKGGCALNGPAAPACKWRECGGHGFCYAYPKSTGKYDTIWYGASASLKVVVGGQGGH